MSISIYLFYFEEKKKKKEYFIVVIFCTLCLIDKRVYAHTHTHELFCTHFHTAIQMSEFYVRTFFLSFFLFHLNLDKFAYRCDVSFFSCKREWKKDWDTTATIIDHATILNKYCSRRHVDVCAHSTTFRLIVSLCFLTLPLTLFYHLIHSLYDTIIALIILCLFFFSLAKCYLFHAWRHTRSHSVAGKMVKLSDDMMTFSCNSQYMANWNDSRMHDAHKTPIARTMYACVCVWMWIIYIVHLVFYWLFSVYSTEIHR